MESATITVTVASADGIGISLDEPDAGATFNERACEFGDEEIVIEEDIDTTFATTADKIISPVSHEYR